MITVKIGNLGGHQAELISYLKKLHEETGDLVVAVPDWVEINKLKDEEAIEELIQIRDRVDQFLNSLNGHE